MPRKSSLYTRVTTVLGWIDSNWYQYWLKGLAKITSNPLAEADRISDESAYFGTQVHKLVEGYLRGKEVIGNFSVRERECAGHIIQWLKEVKAEVLMIDGKPAIEFEVKSEKLGLIGHFDAVLLINGIPWIVDFKTSSNMRKSFPLQKAAYCQMLKMQYNIQVNDGVTLRVDRDPTAKQQFEVAEYHHLLEEYWPIFNNALDVYKYFNGKGKYAKSKTVSSLHEGVQ